MPDANITRIGGVTDFSDQTIKNVQEIQLKTIVSDDDTSVSLGLGTDVGDNLIVATDKLVVLGNNGRIGIGTASPSNILEIEGSSGDLILEIDNNVSNSANFQIQNGAGNARVDLVMNDGSANTTITMKGQKVGIGDTSPTYGLDVNGTVRAVGAATFDSNISCSGVVAATGFTIGSAEITEAELEILDGATATTAELNYSDTGAAAGVVVASKVLTVDANKDLGASGALNNATVDGYIHLKSDPADNKSSGVTATFTAGETLEIGELCYLHTDGKMKKAFANAGSTTTRCVAMALTGIANDATGLFLLQGFFQCTGSFPTYAAGDTLYVPEVEVGSKAVPEAAAPADDGDLVQVVGFATGTDTIYFRPSGTVIEVA